MGLDMYLSAKRYTSEYTDKELHAQLVPLANKALPPTGDDIGSIEIKRDVAYWRKANQIHSWFVTHVQEGKDDCGYYDVSREQLEELRDTCRKVLDSSTMTKGKIANGYSFGPGGEQKPILEDGEYMTDPAVAKELLPTTSGFFFGGTEYDQWYVDDLKNTVEQIDRILAWCDAEQALTGQKYSSVDFQYHSSW